MRKSDDNFIADLKRIATMQYIEDSQDPTAWPRFLQAIMQKEEDDPRTRHDAYMSEKLTNHFLSSLSERGKTIRYSKNDYLDLIGRFGMVHCKPLLAAFSLEIILHSDDPTERLEEALRFAEVTMGAKFSVLTEEERKQSLIERARERAQADGISRNEGLSAQVNLEFERADHLRHLKLNLDQLIEYTIKHFLRALSKRGLPRRQRSCYKKAITYLLSISDESELTTVGWIRSAQCELDPTVALTEALAEARITVRTLDSLNHNGSC